MSFSLIDAVRELVSAQAQVGVSENFDVVSMVKSIQGFGVLVAGVLVLMSVYSLGVMAERLYTYARAGQASRKFAEDLRGLLPKNQLTEAVELSKKLSRGHLPKVLGLAIDEYQRGIEATRSQGQREAFDVIAAVNRAVERSSLRTVNDLRRGLGSLATIGSTAPFVGLLGTVWGIIKAFQNMAATGSGGLATVSGAIAEALINTAFGLLVAIPAVMMFNYLTNRVEDMQVDITDSATELVDFFMKEGVSGRGPA